MISIEVDAKQVTETNCENIVDAIDEIDFQEVIRNKIEEYDKKVAKKVRVEINSACS